jgi:hypothetical protein
MGQSLVHRDWKQTAALAAALAITLTAAAITSAATAQDDAAPDGSVTEVKDRANHVTAGFGLELAYPLGSGVSSALDTGSGANIHVGYDVDFGSIAMLYELSGSYLYFPSALRGVRDEDVDLKRLQFGVSVGYDMPIFGDQALIFELYGRLGVGFLNASSVDQGGQSDTGFCYETGLTLHYQVVESLGVGLSGGFGQVLARYRESDSVQWAVTELHFSVGF